MDVTVILNNSLDSIKSAWSRQSKFKKYLAIAGLSIPSFILLRELYWFLYRKYHSLPPGPNGIPLLGILPAWNKGRRSRANISKKYGPIYYVSFGGIPLVLLSSAKLVKQILVQRDFLNRDPVFDAEKDYYHSMNSFGKSNALPFIQVNGDKWKKRRKLSTDTLFKVLNNTNFANLFKQTFNTEVEPYLNAVIKSNKAWYPKEILEYIAFNTIYSTLMDKKLGRNSKLCKKMIKDMNDSVHNSMLDLFVSKG